MASGRVKNEKQRFVDASVTIPVTVAANSTSGYDTKTKIDAAMPSGAEFFMITGYAGIQAGLVTPVLRYASSNGLVVRSLYSSSMSADYVIYFKYII